MNPEALSKQLATIKSRDEFRELFMVLHHWSKPQLFEALFPRLHPTTRRIRGLLIRLRLTCSWHWSQIARLVAERHLSGLVEGILRRVYSGLFFISLPSLAGSKSLKKQRHFWLTQLERAGQTGLDHRAVLGALSGQPISQRVCSPLGEMG